MTQWDEDFVRAHPKEAVDQIYRLLAAVVETRNDALEEAAKIVHLNCDVSTLKFDGFHWWHEWYWGGELIREQCLAQPIRAMKWKAS